MRTAQLLIVLSPAWRARAGPLVGMGASADDIRRRDCPERRPVIQPLPHDGGLLPVVSGGRDQLDRGDLQPGLFVQRMHPDGLDNEAEGIARELAPPLRERRPQ